MSTFEITVQRKSDQHYPIVVESSQSAEQLPIRSEGELRLTPDAITQLLSLMGDPKEYGTYLGQLLFDGTIDDAFAMARAKSPNCLRLLLFLEADDSAIKKIRWERLCAPIDGSWNFLRRDQRIPYSLYIPSITARRFPPIGQHNLSMLILVASPVNSARFGLATFDVAETVASVQAAVGDKIQCDVLAHEVEGAVGVPSLDDLVKQLTQKSYTFLHMVCHGRQADDTALFLADHENQVKVVEGQHFIEELKNIHGPHGLPHFTFLCTCESAKQSDDGAFGGFAGQLVRDLGMPAVVAMTEKISITTAETLISAFYQRLTEHGEVDRALDEATATVSSRHDALVPALFSRLGGRSLFSDSLDRPLTSEEIEYGLERLQTLLTQRAPVLLDEFKQQRETLNRTMGVDVAALNTTAIKERDAALARMNEICGEVLDLSFNAVVLGKPIPAYDERCPFRGLYPFRQEDEEFFCGRETLVQTLQQKLKEHPFLAVLGDSGSGKSSLVLAGLVPALQQAQPQLCLAYMTPSYNPLEQLENCLEPVKDQIFALVVDQFEELFTLCTDPDQQNLFVQQLLAIASPNQKVIFTMRADFIGSCAPYRELTQNQEVIGPMDLTELRSAMEQQARTVGLRFEAGLSNTILGAMQGERGAMPLLQHALRELWQRRHGRWLLFSEYEHFGGIRQAIAKTAEDFYEPLDPGDKRLMQNIFVRLTRLDTDTEERDSKRDTRRRVTLDELVPANGDLARTQELVARLAGEGARLVTTSENVKTQKTEVEVAHEALIRYWPRLTRWLEDNRNNYQHREEVREDALRWQKGGCKEDDLILRNSLLEQARELQRLELLNDAEQIYVEKSFNFQEKKRDTELRRARRNTRLSAIVAVIFSILSVFAFSKMKEANDERKNAEISSIESLQKFAETFLLSDQNLDALVISLQAGKKLQRLNQSYWISKENKKRLENLQRSVTEILRESFYSVKERDRFHVDGDVSSLLIKDRQILSVFIKNNSIIIKDLNSDTLKHKIAGHGDSLQQNTTLSFDGNKLVAFSEEEDRFYLWNLKDDKTINEAVVRSPLIGNNADRFRFSPDGSQLVFMPQGHHHHDIGLWYIPQNKVIFKDLKKGLYPTGVGFGNRNQVLLALGEFWDGNGSINEDAITIEGWEGQDPNALFNRPDSSFKETEVYFNYDGTFRAIQDFDFIEGMDGNIYLINGHGRQFAVLKGSDDEIDSIGFSSDSRKVIATAGDFDDEKIVKYWDLETLKIVQKETDFKSLNYKFQTLSFSKNGQIATTAEDGAVRLFNLEGQRQGETIERDDVSFSYVSFSADGRWLAMVGSNNTAYLYNIEDKKLVPLEKRDISLESVTFSQDGNKLAVLGSENIINLWDVSTNSPKRLDKETIDQSKEPLSILDIRFEPNGTLVFVKQIPSRLHKTIISLSSGKKIKTLERNADIRSIEIDPNDSFIAMVLEDFSDDFSDDAQTISLTTNEGRELLELDTGHNIQNMAFHPTGELLATIGMDGSIKLWELGGLDKLIDKGCDWVGKYLENPYADLTAEQQSLCSQQ